MSRILQQRTRRFGLVISVLLHTGILLALVWGVPKLARRLNQSRIHDRPMELSQVAPHVAVPVVLAEPAVPPVPEIAPELPAPEPAKPTEAPPPVETKSKPRQVQRQTNRVVRTTKETEAVKDVSPPVDPEAVKRVLSTDIPPVSSIVPPAGESDPALAAYYDRVYLLMHAAWIQPPEAVAGLKADMVITVGPDGRITSHEMRRGSGTPAMDDSVIRAVQSVHALPPPPSGFGAPREIVITFIRDG